MDTHQNNSPEIRLVFGALLTLVVYATLTTPASAVSAASEQVYKKAQSLINAERFTEALLSANEAVRLDQQKADYYDMRARAYEGAKRYKEALVDVQKSRSLNPRSAEPYYRCAQLENVTGHPVEALKDSDTALKLGGPQWYFSVGRSEIFERLNRATESLQAAEEAMRMNPQAHCVYFRVAVGLRMLNRDGEALKMVDRAISMHPESYYLFERARENINLHNWAPAIADFNQVQKMDGAASPELFRLRGYAYIQLKDYKNATRDYERTSEKNSQFLQDRAKLHRIAHDSRLLLLDLNEILAVDPNNAEALRERPFAAFRSGAYQDCINEATSLIAASAQNSQWYYLRGYSYAKLGSYSTAVDDLTKAIQAAPQYKDAYELRSNVYRKLGKEAQAIKDQETVAALSTRR